MKSLMRFPALLIALAMFAAVSGFTGCTNSAGVKTTPAQGVFELKQNYEVALTIAVAYKQLPACGAGAPTVCSNPPIVKQLQLADSTASAALDAAENAVRDPNFDKGAAQAAIVAANQAVIALTQITAILPHK